MTSGPTYLFAYIEGSKGHFEKFTPKKQTMVD